MHGVRAFAITALVSATLVAASAQAKPHVFDMGPEGSPVWEGAVPITAETVYSKETGYGWRRPAGRGITHRLRGVPDALACDLVGAMDNPYDYAAGTMEFLLDLPNGEYAVYVLATDYYDRMSGRYHARAAVIAAEGGEKFRRSWTDEQWLQDYVFRNMNKTYRKGDDVYDKYVAPRFAPIRFNVNVADEQLTLHFSNTVVNALVVYPAAEAKQGEAFLADLDRKRRAAFGYEDDTPRPEGALGDVSDAERKAGYVVFFPHTLDKVYPFDLPKAEQRNGELRAFASLGEFEPVAFAIHPLIDLGECTVSVGDLKSRSGAVLAASHWDVRMVRYLELPDKRGGRRFRTEPLLLMKRERVKIEQGVNRQFRLTVKVPGDAQPGGYKGSVVFRPQNGPETRIPLKLLVLPYRLKPLEDSGRYSGIWHTYPKYTIDRSHIAADLRDHGVNVIHGCRVPRATLVDGKVVLGDTKEAEDYLDAYRKAGFPMKLIVWQGALTQAYSLTKEPRQDAEWLKARGGHSDHQVKKSFSKEFDDVHKQLARAIADLFKAKGWPEIYFYDSGEGGTEGYWGIWTEAHLLKNLKEAGVKGTTSTVGLAALKAELPYLYAAQISSSNASPDVRKRIRDAGVRLWLYGFGYNRFQRGFLFWKTGAEGCAIEGYAHVYGEPFNEFDGAYAYEGEVWPGPDGPIPSLHWEELREGIDDCRYVSHLDLLIKEATRSERKAAQDGAKAARATLDALMEEIDPDIGHYTRHGNPIPSEMDTWRWKIANQIQKLQRAME